MFAQIQEARKPKGDIFGESFLLDVLNVQIVTDAWRSRNAGHIQIRFAPFCWRIVVAEVNQFYDTIGMDGLSIALCHATALVLAQRSRPDVVLVAQHLLVCSAVDERLWNVVAKWHMATAALVGCVHAMVGDAWRLPEMVDFIGFAKLLLKGLRLCFGFVVIVVIRTVDRIGDGVVFDLNVFGVVAQQTLPL